MVMEHRGFIRPAACVISQKRMVPSVPQVVHPDANWLLSSAQLSGGVQDTLKGCTSQMPPVCEAKVRTGWICKQTGMQHTW